MGGHVCPWWLACTFDNPGRRLFHRPAKIFSPYVSKGMTVLDLGCGPGYFSIGLAGIVGETGRVISVDLQPEMLAILQKRALRNRVAQIIHPHLCEQDSIGISEQVDFALAFWMVHEAPDAGQLFRQVFAVLKAPGRLLVAEPWIHVPQGRFQQSIARAREAGFQVAGSPKIAFSHTALLEKTRAEP